MPECWSFVVMGWGAANKNLEEWGGKNVWWQQTNFGVCKKFVGSRGDKKFLGSKKNSGGTGLAKNYVGRRQKKFGDSKKNCWEDRRWQNFGDAGGGTKFWVGDSRESGKNNQN